MLHPRGRSEPGFTLAELMVSIGVFAVGIPILLSTMLFSYGVLKKNAHEVTALTIARRKMENLMNLQYNSLSTSAHAYDENNVPLDSAGKLKASVTAAVVNIPGTTRKTIAVSVRWSEQGRAFSITLHTLVSSNSVT